MDINYNVGYTSSMETPTREEVVYWRDKSQAMVACSRRGEVTIDEARSACQHYIDLAYTRQKAVFGKIKCRININHLMR